MDQSPESRSTEKERKEWLGESWRLNRWGIIVVACVFAPILCCVCVPMPQSQRQGGRSALMQQARQVGQILFSYASDNAANGNAYPDGKSSTEVFQMLLDKGYANDPNVFYVPMPGKVKPEPNQKKLKPENVSFDLTGGVTSDDSDFLPLVFLTGYRVNYVPDGAAVPILKPFPDYRDDHFQLGSAIGPGIAVLYKGNNAMWLRGPPDSGTNGTNYALEHFISKDFDAKGKTYHQLTPDGVLR